MSGAHLKLYCGSIKRTSVNFNIKEKQGQFYPGITQEQHYPFHSATCFTNTILFTIFFFRHIPFYRYLISNITIFLLNVHTGSILWLTVASAFSNKSENLYSQLANVVFLQHVCCLFLFDALNFIIDNSVRLLLEIKLKRMVSYHGVHYYHYQLPLLFHLPHKICAYRGR